MTDDIKTLMTTIYASIASGDSSGWADSLADDIMMIGTDEAEWWQGRDAVLPVLEAQLSEMSAAGISFTGGEPVVGEAGGIVWAADRPTIHLPDGSSQALRATIVAAREAGGLVVRQMHLSAPAPNEQVVQTELTV
jgi:ketosteroid isomerase-like protein